MDLNADNFLPIGLSSCPFCSSFILNNSLRTTACLSDVNVNVYISLIRFMIFSFSIQMYMYMYICTVAKLYCACVQAINTSYLLHPEMVLNLVVRQLLCQERLQGHPRQLHRQVLVGL